MQIVFEHGMFIIVENRFLLFFLEKVVCTMCARLATSAAAAAGGCSLGIGVLSKLPGKPGLHLKCKLENAFQSLKM